MRYVFGILFLVGGLIGGYFAVDTVLWQHRACRDFIQVDCTILSAQVAAHRSRRSTSYSADISYQYTHKGQTYTSDRVFPFYETGSSSWANSIVSRYHPAPVFRLRPELPDASASHAYIDPDHPADSVLVRQYSFTPYLLSAFALFAVAIGAGMLVRTLGGGRNLMAPVTLDASDTRLLLPVKSMRSRLLESSWWAGSFALATIPAAFHWLIIAGQSSAGSLIAMVIGGALLLWSLIIVIRRWLVCRHLSDARLFVRPAPMLRGQPFSMDVEIDAYSPLRISQARCKVICTQHYQEKRGNKTHTGTRTHTEQMAILSQQSEVPAGQVFSGKGELTFEPSVPPTTDPPHISYPRYTWLIRVEVDLQGMVDYRADFPLEVD